MPPRLSTLPHTINVTTMQVADVGRTILISNVPLLTISHPVISVSGGLVPLVIKRSLDQFAAVGSSLAWVTCATSFAYEASCYFLANFPLSSDLIYDWAKMHQKILRGRNPRLPHTNRSLRMQSILFRLRRASCQLLAKE